MNHKKKPLIAVVDDDPSVRKALQRLLQSAGYTVMIFSSAIEFLEMNILDDIKCLILDMRMPEVSGLALQDILNALGVQVPVIFITAHTTKQAYETALEKGAVAYLQKPFDDQELIDAIQSGLENKQNKNEANQILK